MFARRDRGRYLHTPTPRQISLFKLSFWITDVYIALASCGAVYCNRSCL